MSKKKDWVTWLAMAIFVLAGINVVLNLISMPYPLLSTVVLILGFFGIMAMVYGFNQFKFRSLLDLTLFSIMIGIFGVVGVGAGAFIPQNSMLVSQVFAGFQPLLTGVTVGGIIAALISFISLKQYKK